MRFFQTFVFHETLYEENNDARYKKRITFKVANVEEFLSKVTRNSHSNEPKVVLIFVHVPREILLLVKKKKKKKRKGLIYKVTKSFVRDDNVATFPCFSARQALQIVT